jgi:hypothetical protein
MIQEIMQYIKLIPEFKPVARKVIDGLKVYEEEYDEIVSFVIDCTIANKVKMYKAFQAAGIKDDHALALTTNVYQEFQKAAKEFGSKVQASKASDKTTK